MTSEESKICALCKIFSSGDLLYVRESETSICNDHHLYDDVCNMKDDDTHLNSYQSEAKKKAAQNRRSRSELTLTIKDKHEKKQYLGGDGDKNIIRLNKPASRDNLKNEIKLKNAQNDINILRPKVDTEIAVMKTILEQNSQENDNLETTLMYRNTNFRDSCNSSSTSTLLQDIANDKYVFLKQATDSVEKEEDITKRPVSCPVAECSKMLTINSIFSHFHFDHPKIPIINLDRSITLAVKMNRLTSQKTCLAVLLPSASKNIHYDFCCDGVECTSAHYKKSYPLLLMADKYEIEENNETQPNFSNYALLLWLCSIDINEAVYSITVTSEDNKFSKNCIGPAFSLRDGDVPALQLSEPLMIQAAAVNLLCQKQDRIIIVVQCLD